MLGIIAGSGLQEIEGASFIETIEAETPYGMPSAPILKYEFAGRMFHFLSRHGQNHSIPPHAVNYRANVWALKKIGVERIISISAVGGINSNYSPGDIVIADQIIDFTKNRINTFFDSNDVVHVDFTYPFCDHMRRVIIDESKNTGLNVIGEGTYVAVEGPRLETANEIEFYRLAGGDMVGMTGMPEAVLARESEICYAGMYTVTNYAAGMAEGRLTTEEVVRTMKESNKKIKGLLSRLVSSLDAERICFCEHALDGARL